MMISFTEVLESIVDNPTNPIGDIIKTDVSAYAELNNTKIDYPEEPLHVLLAKQAKITPEKTAIQFGNVENTYKELYQKSNNIAAYLIDKGITPGDFVAVSLPKSIELIPILIAILETGAAYLPLDPQYPKNRLEFMLEDSEAKLLITTEELSPTFKTNVETLFLGDILSSLSQKNGVAPMVEVSNDKEAYILYTSGSTGKPKGVSITHRNLVNFLFSMLKEPGINENDRLLSVTTISFDIAGLEMFVPLLKGATLVLADEETAKDSRLLWDVLNNENITMMQATPTTWQMLLETGWNKRLPLKALCGGEALPLVLAKNLLEKVDELWNMYGPTETTIWSAVNRILESDEVISIGRPIANTRIYIVDEQNRLVEPGKTGELCIAGDGVARGYWKRPNLLLKNS
ncbi:amino acid adenylation domain-containing protein [Maribacter litopenaei]|uniref:Amino acid adenylation domain-containing protein n=1 Tax=Maribacter litopenaei TaxID=2976127 RepID=A0ABY5YAJ9_9FLAO|nr:amino acid adenylation domain-containing protein [Maribacter litopenaei]UWX56080.1 amino acid adenylation domain-containing protein [Maribacter litopenaei]